MKFRFRSTRGSLTERHIHSQLSASACQESFDYPSELLRLLARRQVPALREHPQLAIADTFLRPACPCDRHGPVVRPVHQRSRHYEPAQPIGEVGYQTAPSHLVLLE